MHLCAPRGLHLHVTFHLGNGTAPWAPHCWTQCAKRLIFLEAIVLRLACHLSWVMQAGKTRQVKKPCFGNYSLFLTLLLLTCSQYFSSWMYTVKFWLVCTRDRYSFMVKDIGCKINPKGKIMKKTIMAIMYTMTSDLCHLELLLLIRCCIIKITFLLALYFYKTIIYWLLKKIQIWVFHIIFIFFVLFIYIYLIIY